MTRKTWRMTAWLAAGLLTVSASASDDREEIVVIKAGRLVTVSGDTMEDAEVVVIDGKIELIGRGLEYPASAEVIDASDQTVMPGMLHAQSRYGLRGYNRSGVRGHLLVADELELDRIDFEPLLEAGFTGVCFYPPGAGISGQSVLVRCAGPDDERILDNAVHLRVPMTDPSRDKPALNGALKKAQAEIDKVKKAREEWDKKQAEEAKKREAEEAAREKEGEGGGADGEEEKPKEGEEEKPAEKPEFKPPVIDPGHQALVDLIEGDEDASPMLIQLRNTSGLLHLQDLLSQRDDDLPYFLHLTAARSDWNYALDMLAEHEGLILTPPTIGSMPSSAERFNAPGEFAALGLDIAMLPALDSPGGWNRHRAQVMDLVRYGFDRDHAVRSITVNPARLLGVDERLGTIEKGKDADLVFLDGRGGALDPLSRVQRVMILGEIVWEREDPS